MVSMQKACSRVLLYLCASISWQSVIPQTLVGAGNGLLIVVVVGIGGSRQGDDERGENVGHLVDFTSSSGRRDTLMERKGKGN